MKLTESKLKQLILEQMDSFKLGNLIAYFEELEQVISSFPQYIQDEIKIVLLKKGTPINQPGLSDPPEAFTQAAIESLDREIRGEALEREWEYVAVYRQISIPDEYGLPGDIEVLLMIHRDGRKELRIIQYSLYEDELFDYYKAENISISDFANFVTSSTEDIVEYAKEENRMSGRKI
jgi:hypothetical protein